jgi:hypothetical protein
MTSDQKIVGVGAASGIAAMLLGLLVLTPAMPTIGPAADVGARLPVALRWDAVAILPRFLAITAIGNARFTSEAIDPTAGKESRAMLINGRVVDNTVQQYVLFLMATLGVAASDGAKLEVVEAAAIVFVLARFAFWIGYRIHPLYRAFGMAATSYLSVVLFAYALWLNLAGQS